MPESPLAFALVGLAIVLYGFSKTGVPGFGVLAGPLLAAILGATTASAFALPLLIVGDLFALARYRQHVNWPLIVRLVPGVIVGIAVTALMFDHLDEAMLGRFVGVLILASVLLEVWRRRRASEPARHPARQRAEAGFFGALAGMTTMAANSGGAAMQLYLVSMRVPMLAFMGTFAWFFFIINLIKVPVSIGLGILTPQTLVAGLPFVPAVLLGAVLGYLTFARMAERVFTNLALGLSAVAAAWLLVFG